MKIVKPSVEIQFRDVESNDKIAVYKKLEKIARLCYKSEDKITDDSYVKMLNTLTDRGHFAMLEHHVFVFEVDWGFLSGVLKAISFASDEVKRAFKYLNITQGFVKGTKSYISGSTTAFNNLWNAPAKDMTRTRFTGMIFEMCEIFYHHCGELLMKPRSNNSPHIGESNYMRILTNKEIAELPYEIRRHHDYITALFVTDRGVTHEIVRHRAASYAQESTRYCNYGKDDDVQFILPSWIDRDNAINVYRPEWDYYDCYVGDLSIDPFKRDSVESWWFWACANSEVHYTELIKQGWKPQQARSVLNNSLKTEIYMTANLAEWEWFMKMRIPNTAHPDMRAVSRPLQEEIIKQIPEFPRVDY